MRQYPGMPASQSGSNAFYSDANLDLRAVPAGYSDFGLLPGEVVGDAVAASGALQSHAASGGALTPIPLADIEVDDRGHSADLAEDYLSGPSYAPSMVAALPPYAQSSGAGSVDESSLDRLADLILARVERKLLGEQ